MAEATDTATKLLSVLQALYQTNDKDTRREASKWLEEYQQSTEAWQASEFPMPRRTIFSRWRSDFPVLNNGFV